MSQLYAKKNYVRSQRMIDNMREVGDFNISFLCLTLKLMESFETAGFDVEE